MRWAFRWFRRLFAPRTRCSSALTSTRVFPAQARSFQGNIDGPAGRQRGRSESAHGAQGHSVDRDWFLRPLGADEIAAFTAAEAYLTAFGAAFQQGSLLPRQLHSA